MTQAAIEGFLAENDGLLGGWGMNNFYLYRMADSTRHRFLPWDKDNSFLVPDYAIFQWANDNILFSRAFAYADLRNVYFQVLETAAASAEARASTEEDASREEPGWLEAEIDRIAALVAPSVEEDLRKPFSTEAFYESVVAMKEFARVRPALVRQQIDAARSASSRTVRE
jgi:hypothetical protein